MAAKASGPGRSQAAAPQITNARFVKGSRPLAEVAGPFIQHCCARFGFSEIRLFRDWARVVGPDLASRCSPVKVRRNRKGESVLHLRVPGGFATEVAHCSAAILDRINTVYGFRAVDRIKITQTGPFRPLVPPSPPPPPPPATEREIAVVETLVDGVQNPGLRAALRNLGVTLQVADRCRAEQKKEFSE